MQAIFEATHAQKQMSTVGREMMDMSEFANCKGMKDEDFKLLNDLSHVGGMLTKVGNPTTLTKACAVGLEGRIRHLSREELHVMQQTMEMVTKNADSSTSSVFKLKDRINQAL